MVESRYELAVCAFEGVFRVDAVEACGIDYGKEQVAVFLRELDLLPVHFHLVRCVGVDVAENVRVAGNQFVV